MAGPLEGIRVLDFGQFLAGPFGPMLLADLGADVIKVEPTGATGCAAIVIGSFMGCQRGKRDIALDLKQPDGLRIALELVATADIVHHNMTLGTADRLGIGYEHCKAVRPDILYCNTYMYGAVGPARAPRRRRPARPGRRGTRVGGGTGRRGEPAAVVPLRPRRRRRRDAVGHRRAHRALPPEPDRRGSVDVDVDAPRHDAVHGRLVARRRRHAVAAPDARPGAARPRRAVPALRDHRTGGCSSPRCATSTGPRCAACCGATSSSTTRASRRAPTATSTVPS